MSAPRADAARADAVHADAVRAALGDAWKEERARVLATVARRTGDLQLAEDAVQEAFAQAVVSWPRDGVPQRPGAWLTTTAWRKAVDARRRDRVAAVPVGDPAEVGDLVDAARTAGGHAASPTGRQGSGTADRPVEDDLLALVLTCCHPALAPEAQVALTLRHVAGLTDAEVASMLLVRPATLIKRLVRARAKIRDAGIRFAVPQGEALARRMEEVRSVVYLVFTEGHLPALDGPAVRPDLCAEAVWLARELHRLVPHDEETAGLAALLLLHHARAAARVDADGALVTLARQDRSRWDPAAVAEAGRLLGEAASTPPGPYRVEAAIALLHMSAPSAEEVDVATVSDLYDVLHRLHPSPVVAVNRALAHGRSRGATAGLAALREVEADPRLGGYAPYWAARGELLERAGHPGAEEAWSRAADLTRNARHREELLHRLADPGPRHDG